MLCRLKTIILFLVFFVISLNVAYSATRKDPKVVTGDCSSSDTKNQYKTKTYIDGDGDGVYDRVITGWCNDKVSSNPWGGGNKIPSGLVRTIDDVTIYEHHLIDYAEYGEEVTFRFEIFDTTLNKVIGIEQKLLGDQMVYFYEFDEPMEVY